jgi:hypothetical protein
MRLGWLCAFTFGCATGSGTPPRVIAGCDGEVEISATIHGAVEIHERGRVRRTVVRSEQREDLDRLLFAAGATEWPACEPAPPRCSVRFIDRGGVCHQAGRAALGGSAGESLLAWLGDVLEAELGAGRRGFLRF